MQDLELHGGELSSLLDAQFGAEPVADLSDDGQGIDPASMQQQCAGEEGGPPLVEGALPCEYSRFMERPVLLLRGDRRFQAGVAQAPMRGGQGIDHGGSGAYMEDVHEGIACPQAEGSVRSLEGGVHRPRIEEVLRLHRGAEESTGVHLHAEEIGIVRSDHRTVTGHGPDPAHLVLDRLTGGAGRFVLPDSRDDISDLHGVRSSQC